MTQKELKRLKKELQTLRYCHRGNKQKQIYTRGVNTTRTQPRYEYTLEPCALARLSLFSPHPVVPNKRKDLKYIRGFASILNESARTFFNYQSASFASLFFSLLCKLAARMKWVLFSEKKMWKRRASFFVAVVLPWRSLCHAWYLIIDDVGCAFFPVGCMHN